MKTRKPITAAKVRAVLKKAGYSASKSSASRVRGLRDHSKGFAVRATMRSIRVTYMSGMFRDGPIEDECRDQRIVEYAATMLAAGIPCEIVGEEVVVRVEPPKSEDQNA